MRLALTLVLVLPAAMLGWGGVTSYARPEADSARQQDTPGAKKPADEAAARVAAPGSLPRGKKLVLTDGSFQLVRDYEKKGDRVRYFSVERGSWEEIPAAMVDWDATKKAEAADAKTTAALLEKVRIQEAAAKAETPVDVDASLTVAPGVFLPDGEGMFAFEGKSVKRLGQAGSEVKTDKKTAIARVFSPIPIIPSKRNVEIPGTRAAVRLTSQTPEFYLREPAADPDHDSMVSAHRSAGRVRPGGRSCARKGEGEQAIAGVHTEPVRSGDFPGPRRNRDSAVGSGSGYIQVYVERAAAAGGVRAGGNPAGWTELVRLGFWCGRGSQNQTCSSLSQDCWLTITGPSPRVFCKC